METRVQVDGSKLGPLFVGYYTGSERPGFDPQHECYKPGWSLGTRHVNGRKWSLVTREGVGLFNSKQEAERAIVSLSDAGVVTGGDVAGLHVDRFRELIYRDLFW